MSLHIYTNETDKAGAPTLQGTCSICGCEGTISVGWTRLHADCGHAWDWEDTKDIVRQRREYLGLSRREMAERLGLKASTVAQYENRWPSKRYWNQTKQMVREAT